MKKSLVGIVVLAVMFVAVGVFAFDIPTSASGAKNMAKKTGGKLAYKTALNKVVENANCAFVKNTDKTTCDLNKLATELAAAKAAAEGSVANNVTINIEAAGSPEKKKPMSASTRAASVEKVFKSKISAWDYNVKPVSSNDNTLKITVDVK